MKAGHQDMVCSATMEFDYVRLSVRDSRSGEGCAMFLHKENLGMVMRELRRVARQLRQARSSHPPVHRAAHPRSRKPLSPRGQAGKGPALATGDGPR